MHAINEITIATPQTHLSTTENQWANLDYWWKLFDLPAAVRHIDYLLKDMGSADTDEQHTRAAYERDLRYFINWAGVRKSPKELLKVSVYDFIERHPYHRLPDSNLMREYIAHLKSERKLTKSTIDRYLAPVRHYLKALTRQTIGARGELRDLISDIKDWIRNAMEEKVRAEKEQGNNLPAMYAHGTRLRATQVNDIFAALAPRTDLLSVRDLALLYLGFNTGLRDAELRRIKLSSIRTGEYGTDWQIVVRGKRNNYQPVPLDNLGYQLIMRYVELYNRGLPPEDPRRIGHTDGKNETAVFQPLRKGGHYPTIGTNGYNPVRGMGKQVVQDIVQRRSEELLGIRITPHDMRRTMAYIGRLNGMEWDDIKTLLRHKSIATTERYVGDPLDMSSSILSSRVSWQFTAAAPTPPLL